MTQIKYIRAKDIAHKYGIGLSTVWKWVSADRLPKPYAKLSPKCTVWNAEEVDKAFEDMHDNPIAEHGALNFKIVE